MRIAFYTILAIISALLAACNPQPEAPKLLAQAQAVKEAYPDSALRLIDSIFYPEKSLSEQQYMYYWVTRVEVRRKMNKPIAEDTLVFVARDYFVKKDNDPHQIALSFLYSGAVYLEQGKMKKAMNEYKKAGNYAQKNHDADLKGLIQYSMGDLLTEESLYDQALKYYKRAQYWCAQSPQKPDEKQAQCFSAMGQMFLLSDKPDSAVYSFHKGLKLAETTENNELKSLLAQNLSVAYTQKKQYEQAEEYLRKSFLLNTDTTELPRYYLNFAKIYTKSKQTDSAFLYVNKLKQEINASSDIYFKASAYNFLADWEKEQGNYEAAFDYKDERIKAFNQIFKQTKEQSVYEVHQKYDFELLQNKHNRKQIKYLLWLIFLLALIVVGGITFTLYMLSGSKQLALARSRLDTLNRINARLHTSMEQKKQDLHKTMLRELDIAKKIISLNKEFSKGYLRNNNLIEQVNHILYGEKSVEQQWEVMYGTFNAVRPGLADRIREKYPSLSELEYRICLLTYAGFKVDEIALVLNSKPNTVQTLRTAIRKKTGAAPGEDIAGYLEKAL